MGHDQVVLFGSSYGTHLALHADSRQPDGVHALVLDSPVDPSENYIRSYAAGFQDALDRLAEACASDDVCSQQLGDVEEALESMVDRLADTPDEVTTAPPTGGDESTIISTPTPKMCPPGSPPTPRLPGYLTSADPMDCGTRWHRRWTRTTTVWQPSARCSITHRSR